MQVKLAVRLFTPRPSLANVSSQRSHLVIHVCLLPAHPQQTFSSPVLTIYALDVTRYAFVLLQYTAVPGRCAARYSPCTFPGAHIYLHLRMGLN